MKNFLTKLPLICLLAVICGVFTGCKEEEENGYGSFSISAKEVGPDFVTLSVTAPASVQMAYQFTKEPILTTPAVLFKTGVILDVNPGDSFTIEEGIEQDTKYYFYAAAKLDEQNYSDLVSVEFTTKKYGYKDMLTLVKTYLDGYKVHIVVPQATKDRGNVIRYGSTSLAWYNLLKNSKGGDAVDLNAVVANGNPYGNYVKNDSTIVMNDMNVVILDENGQPVYDENGETMDIHDPIAPGEPTIFLAGECRWGTPDEYAEVMGFYAPDKSSYSIPLFDWQNGWTGAFDKITFFAKEPTVSDAKVTVDIPEDEIGITDANVYFEMDEDVVRYFYMILDNATYNQVLALYLDGHEEWWQWFLTSYIAFYEWGVYPRTESISVNAASSFVEPLTGGETYHVLVNAFGDENGSAQNFVHKTFKAKEKTKPAPVIKVNPVPSDNPYEVTFNVKAPNKDVVGAYWACNYAREFELMFNAGFTYNDLLKGNYSFSTQEIAAINSEEGYTVSFQTLDGEVTRLAVLGCNDEYTFNYIDGKVASAGWADCASPMLQPAAPVSSPLYEALAGDWTATATIVAKEKTEDDEVISYNVKHQSKVTISRSAPAVPAEVPDSVYTIYKDSKSEDEVNSMYEELVELTQQFTDYRIVGQNRMLCSGFIDFDYYKDPGRMTFRSPFELFAAKNYASVDVPQLLYDFGPKWFLEVQADGSVIVPFHSTMLPPMHNWPGYPFYVAGLSGGSAFYDSNDQIKGFPVEISEKMDKITIKPIVLKDDKGNDVPYYMNAVGIDASNPGSLEVIASVISEIVLTKGWNGSKEDGNVEAAPSTARAMSIDGQNVTSAPQVKVYKSMTKMQPAKKVVYTKEEKANQVTMDMVEKTSDKILKHFNVK